MRLIEWSLSLIIRVSLISINFVRTYKAWFYYAEIQFHKQAARGLW